MTAFYMFRLYYCIFWGKTNDNYAHHTPHESPVVMTLPLMILAAITIVAGWIMPFGHFVSSNGHAYDIHLDTTVATTSIIVAVVAILIATWMYAGKTQPVQSGKIQTYTMWFLGGIIILTAVRVVGKILYGTCENPEHLKLTDATWDERFTVICLIAAVA